MDSNELLNDLQNYMTTNSFIKKYNKNVIFKENSGIQKIKLFHDECIKYNSHKTNRKEEKLTDTHEDSSQSCKEIKRTNYKYDFSPSEKDKLFWCFYIFINGYEKYELEKTSSFKIEKEFKFMIAEKLNSLKNELKELGIKKNDVREELTNDKCISIKSLLILSRIYKIKLLYVKNNYFYLIEPPENTEAISNLKCIIEEKDKVYIKDINDTKEEQDAFLLHYKENYWQIENFNKPIKSFSSYSLIELQDICKKLKLPIEINNKKKLKKELYESIIKVF